MVKDIQMKTYETLQNTDLDMGERLRIGRVLYKKMDQLNVNWYLKQGRKTLKESQRSSYLFWRTNTGIHKKSKRNERMKSSKVWSFTKI